MAKSVNKVILLGNIGKDPEVKFLPSGMAVANFSLATSERFKDKTGESQDRTEWHNLVAFGKVAEIIRDYVKKGAKLYVEGSLRTSSWEDKESKQKRYKTEIVVNDISLLSGRGDGEAGASGAAYGRGGGSTASFDQRAPAPAEDYGQSAEITDDDIPF
ncbi:MAG TPA: single-stranded DNA-binding protein [Acidisarcina sp.]